MEQQKDNNHRLALCIMGATLLIIIVAFISSLLCSCSQTGGIEDRMKNLARENILASADVPESVKFLGVSKPDSAFGSHYYTEKEAQGVMKVWQRISDIVEKEARKAKSIEDIDKDVLLLAQRQMQSQFAVEIILSGTPEKKEFSGWKVKVDYEAKSEDGIRYKAERWLYLSKDGNQVINIFEIPLP